jgi:kumamolisin
VKRSALLAVLALHVAVLVGCGGDRPSEGARLEAPTADSYLGPTAPETSIAFSLALRIPGKRRLDAELRTGRPLASIGARGFGERYGLSRHALRRLDVRLRKSGVSITRSYAQRTALEALGSVGDVGRLFGVGFGDYVDAQGRRFRAPTGPPVVPAELRHAVAGVADLSTRPVAITSAVPAAGFKPLDLAKAYGVAPLWRRGIRGRGQTIAVVSFAALRPADIAAFDRATGLRAGRIERIKLLGGSSDVSSEIALEAALDVETVRGIAPAAKILHYELPYEGTLDSFTRGVGVAIDAIVEDGRADVVSISYGICDAATTRDGKIFLPRADRLRAQAAFAAAARVGISVFVATQDQGAYTCQRFDLEDHRLSTSWPGGDPNVVSVGGTRLSVRGDGAYESETGWEDVLSTFGGGGGVNPQDPRPAWQRAPGVRNRYSNGRRQLPDVAAAADFDSGVFVVFQGRETVVGGTSAATPFWAGAAALISQAAEREGNGPVGYINPLLYAVARTSARDRAFHDVTGGGNRFYAATPGWDYATGLGSPDVEGLASAVVEVLASRRSP